jgi:DNA-directed RNA polymerase delta subunit
MVAAEVGQGPGIVQSLIDVKVTYGHAQERGIDLVECMMQAFFKGWQDFTDCQAKTINKNIEQLAKEFNKDPAVIAMESNDWDGVFDWAEGNFMDLSFVMEVW